MFQTFAAHDVAMLACVTEAHFGHPRVYVQIVGASSSQYYSGLMNMNSLSGDMDEWQAGTCDLNQ